MIILFSGSLIDGDAKHERDLVLANAILVYELNDFLINYIERFERPVVEHRSRNEK